MKVLVTGGAGFLGRSIVEELLQHGHQVSSLARREQEELEARGARAVLADLRDAERVRAAVAGHDAVVHTAAKTGVWGAEQDYFQANVLGTRHVLEACRAEGVARLVYTSSPSVCFDGKDHVQAKNDLPYAPRFLCAYARSKALAEREVLAASGPKLATCALRPHLIVGARDPHLVPRLLARARAGRLRIVGDGENMVSLTRVENAALAHRLAVERLAPAAAHAGRAYFVAQREAVALWGWIRELLARHGLRLPRRRVPLSVAYGAGSALERVWRIGQLRGEPPMTRFVALQLARSHTYDLAPLERDLGYVERLGMDGLQDELEPLGLGQL